jgi:hypothetical protein
MPHKVYKAGDLTMEFQELSKSWLERAPKDLSHQITEGHQLNSIELKGICKGLIREKEIGVVKLQTFMKQTSIEYDPLDFLEKC